MQFDVTWGVEKPAARRRLQGVTEHTDKRGGHSVESLRDEAAWYRFTRVLSNPGSMCSDRVRITLSLFLFAPAEDPVARNSYRSVTQFRSARCLSGTRLRIASGSG